MCTHTEREELLSKIVYGLVMRRRDPGTTNVLRAPPHTLGPAHPAVFALSPVMTEQLQVLGGYHYDHVGEFALVVFG
jgi:hypothetical protein